MEDAYVHMHIYLSEFIEFIPMPLTGNKERSQSSSAGTHSTRPPERSPENVRGVLRLSNQPPPPPSHSHTSLQMRVLLGWA